MKQPHEAFDLKSFDVKLFDSILAKGLSYGLGKRENQVCIEAAICQTLGLPHGDNPKCVSHSVRAFKIRLNDSKWSSSAARAKGLRNLGIAQLGSRGIVDDEEFQKLISKKTISILIPKLFRQIFPTNKEVLAAALRCEIEGSKEAAAAAAAAANAVAAVANTAAAAVANAAAAATATYAAYAATYAAYAAADAASAAATYAVDAADAVYAAADAAAYAAAAAIDAAAAAAAAANAVAVAAVAADAAAAAAAAADSYLNLSASLALEVLIELKSPGVQLLSP